MIGIGKEGEKSKKKVFSVRNNNFYVRRGCMKNLKLFLALLMMVVMLPVFGGGGSSSPTDMASGEKPTIRLMTSMSSSQHVTKDTWLFMEYGAAANAWVEPLAIPRAEYRDKLVTVLASGDLPDIMLARGAADPVADIVDQYGPEGVFEQIDKHWAKLPSLKKWYDKFPDAYKISTSADGHIYGIPTFNEYNAVSNIFEIRADLLRKGGVEWTDVDTLEDVTNALRILKQQNGGKPPLSLRWTWAQKFQMFCEYFGTLNTAWYDEKADTYKFGPLTDRYKIMIETMASWYKEGLLHPDFHTMEDQFLEGLYMTGDITSKIGSPGWDYSTAIPGSEQQAIKTPLINGVRYGQPSDGNVSYKMPWVISADSKYIDNCLKLIDFMYTDYGAQAPWMGKEGLTWKKRDDGKPEWMTKSDANPDAENVYFYGIANSDLLRVELNIWGPKKNRGPLRPGDQRDPERIANFMVYLDKTGSIGAPTPQVKLSNEELATVQEKGAVLNTLIDENSLRFILGTKPMSQWDAFINDVKAQNPQEIVTIFNDALKRYKASGK